MVNTRTIINVKGVYILNTKIIRILCLRGYVLQFYKVSSFL